MVALKNMLKNTFPLNISHKNELTTTQYLVVN